MEFLLKLLIKSLIDFCFRKVELEKLPKELQLILNELTIISKSRISESQQDYNDLCQECAQLIFTENLKINAKLNKIYLEAQIYSGKIEKFEDLEIILNEIFFFNQLAIIFYLKACFEVHIGGRLELAKDYLKNSIANIGIDTASNEFRLKVNFCKLRCFCVFFSCSYYQVKFL